MRGFDREVTVGGGRNRQSQQTDHRLLADVQGLHGTG
jgi:hypothetical protein